MIQSGWVEGALLCAEQPEDEACPEADAFPATDVLYEQFDLAQEDGWGYDAYATCGPDAGRLDACCYEVTVGNGGGTALHGGWRARTARDSDAGGWVMAQSVERDGVSPRAVAGWPFVELSARHEHASVASFARAAMELLARVRPRIWCIPRRWRWPMRSTMRGGV